MLILYLIIFFETERERETTARETTTERDDDRERERDDYDPMNALCTRPTRPTTIPRIDRRLQENIFFNQKFDPSLRVQTSQPVSCEFPHALLLAAHGGYAKSLETHVDSVNSFESLAENVAVIKKQLDQYSRPSDFSWVSLNNGLISIVGDFDASGFDALRVDVDVHLMLDPTSVDADVELPPLRIRSFACSKSSATDHTIGFSEEFQLVGLTSDSSPDARLVAQDAGLSFLRPSGNRSRVMSVTVHALDDSKSTIGPVISSRLFDIEYRWNDLAREQARFHGSAPELNGTLLERTTVVKDAIKKRSVVAAIVSSAVASTPHVAEALAARLFRYDTQLISNPELLKQKNFLIVMSVVSDTLLPLLNHQLKRNPAKRNEVGFANAYNLCNKYASGEVRAVMTGDV